MLCLLCCAVLQKDGDDMDGMEQMEEEDSDGGSYVTTQVLDW